MKVFFHNRRSRLTFANSVVEIKPGRRNELFERFYRPDTSRNTQTRGFGIGLATVKAIVEAHKGKVSARAASVRIDSPSVMQNT